MVNDDESAIYRNLLLTIKPRLADSVELVRRLAQDTLDPTTRTELEALSDELAQLAQMTMIPETKETNHD